MPRNERVSAKFQAAHMYYKSSLRRKLEIQSDDAISDGALYHPPRNVCYIYRGDITISEFFEKIFSKEQYDGTKRKRDNRAGNVHTEKKRRIQLSSLPDKLKVYRGA